MSADMYHWARKLHEIRFGQLEVARRQAESWRTGLAGLATLLGVVLVVKGRDGFSGVAGGWRWAAVVFLALALVLLVAAALFALSAAHGSPADSEILGTPEDLRDWTRVEVERIGRFLRLALGLTLAGVAAVVTAVGVTWLAPAQESSGTLVQVDVRDVRHCGRLVSAANGEIVVAVEKTWHVVRLDDVTRLETVEKCPA
ncbi:hypothetical protein [Actinocorallia populi]|uniref:hypothetical protein n=1 Tax=Actinocorallia populi TaxID=2079200 RepID=UPI0013001F5A|nr:hypothetical protein [Actinocorallia populi]